MDSPKTNLRIRWLVCAAVFSVSAVMSWAAVRHGLAAHWARSGQLEQWLHAAAWEPDNPEHWYRLGRYYQIDFENADLPRAISYYQRATAIAPGSAEYWLDLAEAQETVLQLAEAEQAFRRAQQAYPPSAEVSWRFGNFLLRQNRQDEAFGKIHDALSVQPSLTALAISRCWQSTQDIELILNLALPVGAETYWGAIDFLVEAREPVAAMVVWNRLMAEKPSFLLKRAFRLQDMLIETGYGGDARSVWQRSLLEVGAQRDTQSGGSLLWNGGFEQELLNGGMAWRFRPVTGAALSFDGRVAHSQSRSLRVVFDGTKNVDFRQPWQYAVVEPNTRYRLSAYFRTEGLTTNSDLRLEIEETHFGGALQATPKLAGTQYWAPSEAEFTTDADTRLVRVVLRRRPSQKLDNKISGTIWMDDVSLAPVVESAALR
jgi:tetratricopeptide (TPR) repeat protein